jgi:hypothetical protein
LTLVPAGDARLIDVGLAVDDFRQGSEALTQVGFGPAVEHRRQVGGTGQ